MCTAGQRVSPSFSFSFFLLLFLLLSLFFLLILLLFYFFFFHSFPLSILVFRDGKNQRRKIRRKGKIFLYDGRECHRGQRNHIHIRRPAPPGHLQGTPRLSPSPSKEMHYPSSSFLSEWIQRKSLFIKTRKKQKGGKTKSEKRKDEEELRWRKAKKEKSKDEKAKKKKSNDKKSTDEGKQRRGKAMMKKGNDEKNK